ncbi:MAG TPA: isocitrate/isopropylmalate family dehydrogenase, partial [bacterium]|nr:isocitrate/isopropylmalate family dehydrogenase [bacterium]
EFERYDLSLANRRRTQNTVVREAADALRTHRYGIKAATITPETADDVGSPNALLREWIDATVILRTGRRIPGVRPVAGVVAPIAVVRMAVGDAYSAREWREGTGNDEVAYRTTRITRRHCRAVAEFAFRHARTLGAKVFGGPKYTVSPVYEGLLKEEVDAAALRHPDVLYDPQLIDAVYALLLQSTGEGLVIPALNRDGDTLSDFVLQMFGSIAGAESLVLSIAGDLSPTIVLAEAPHGTAPRLFGKNLANPMAMILACAALVAYLPHPAAAAASRAIYESTFEAVQAGIRTVDLGGAATTTEFTDEVIRRLRLKLDVWRSLGRV